ncbi:Mas-related G-protein coupled receptor member D [Bacillus sp. WMMC1349]|uniref:Mas-related G-protein coupled receptor member D n=1 Tax=Bacillus sp. WMMC1349 TaxID=2736254 RepID=UPI001556907A|nr:Mas-related G-protein coupled receptor member D [Bacillus sp. WMMC1349]NPC91892.1 Mas-related G-protein coupled receptor member D [Bacillus sp. WMMC1349]
MNPIFLIISILALGTFFLTFIYMIFNSEWKGMFKFSRTPVKVMSGAFLVYLVFFILFIVTQP